VLYEIKSYSKIFGERFNTNQSQFINLQRTKRSFYLADYPKCKTKRKPIMFSFYFFLLLLLRLKVITRNFFSSFCHNSPIRHQKRPMEVKYWDK